MPTPPRIAGLVLAAGEGRRFAGPKQLALLDGRPLLAHALDAMRTADCVTPVAVALGAHEQAVRAAVDLDGVEVVTVAGWHEGMSASLRAGIGALAPRADAVVVTLADQPQVDARMIEQVVAAWDGAAPAVRATHGGAPGHPVLLGATLFGAVAALDGDVGARALLEDPGVVLVDAGPASTVDVDTPDQLAALRLRPGRRGSGPAQG